MVMIAWPRTSRCHRAVLRREQSSADFTETSRLRFETAPEPEQLKRTHSDPSLHELVGDNTIEPRQLSFSPVGKDHSARWTFIRQQPEYKRLMRNIELKRAFEEQEHETKETREQSCQTNNTGPILESRKQKDIKIQSSDGSAVKRKEKQLEKSGHLQVRDRLTSAKSENDVAVSRHFPNADSRRGVRRVSCQTSTEITSLDVKGTPDRRNKRSQYTGNGRRQDMLSNVTLPESSGIGQISLQMTDFHRPGITKTMSMNYSSSVLFQNSRILSEDLIRVSGKKEAARQAFVRRTERRIKILQKNRELREKSKAELDRMKRMEEENDLETVYYKRPETTILARPTGDMTQLTAGDKKDFRKERIKERTLLLPENFKTVNYLKDFNSEQYKTATGASYLRGSDQTDQ